MTTPCSSAVAPTAQKTALLVASGGDVDELLTNVLASDGWSIQRVADNQHILALARAKPFDLIVADGIFLGFFPKLAELKLFDNTAEGDPEKGQSSAPKLLLHLLHGRVLSSYDLLQMPEWAKPILQAAFELQKQSVGTSSHRGLPRNPNELRGGRFCPSSSL